MSKNRKEELERIIEIIEDCDSEAHLNNRLESTPEECAKALIKDGYIHKDDVLTDEKALREYLWLSHGHQGLYGDDGEMQCQECSKFGVDDYKRQPLDKIISSAIKAREEVNLKKLTNRG